MKKFFSIDDLTQENLERAEMRARSLEHFDEYDESYEDYQSMSSSEKSDYEREFYDDLEHYKKRGSSHAAASEKAQANLVKRHGRKGAAYAKYRLGVKPRAGTLTGDNINTGAQATFNINVKRNSFNIAQTLPVMIWNELDTYSDNSILKSFVPAGVTVQSAVDVNRQNWVFTFTQGLNIDTITISCSEVAYNKFLLATQTDLLRVGRILYKISNEATQTQFSKQFVVVEQGMYGYAKQNPITLNNFINPSDYRKDSIVINTAFDVDKQTGVILGMTDENVGGAANTVSLGVSVTIFDQWTRKKM